MKFLFGKEEYLIEVEIKKFLKDFSIEAISYDEIANYENILMDILTISMFNKEKVIIIKNHPILKDKIEGKKFLNEFKNANLKDVHLLFVLIDNPDQNNPLIKYLLKNAVTTEIKSITNKDMAVIIRQVVKDNSGSITSGAVIRLSQKLPLNLRLIINEIKKLLFETKNITEIHVQKSIDNHYIDDYFALSNAIMDKNNNGIIKLYNEKISYGETPISIINQIAGILNLSILVDNYKKQGLSLKEISDQNKIHIFRIKKANELINNSNTNKLSNLVLKLADLELHIKTSETNNSRGLDKFILDLIK